MRIAFVYDRVNKWGGAERVLLALHEIWPEAPLFTAVYDKKRAPWANVFDVRTSFLQNIPFVVCHHEFFAWLTPLAFESFSFDDYDVVISVTSAEAKGIITKPHTCHICYCLTPTRYLWSGYDWYVQNPGLGQLDGIVRSVFPHVAPTLQRWDQIAAQRPDYYIAISKHVADRIKKYYGRDVKNVMYPPVDIEKFKIQNSRLSGESPKEATKFKVNEKDYLLVVSRLVSYKRVDLVIEACNKLNVPLVIIGDGLDRSRLERLAGPTIRFMTGYLTDAELSSYYRDCRALVMAQDEDFGITALEALGHGKPVISLRDSAVAEIVEDAKTGLLFNEQTVDSLTDALNRFDRLVFDLDVCRKRALQFHAMSFQQSMKTVVATLYRQYQRRLR